MSILAITGGNIWDTNGISAGTANAGGNWSGSNWTNDTGGLTATTTFTNGSTPTFSAGTNGTGPFTVNVDVNQNVNGITFEEGGVTLGAGGGTLTLTGATIDVANTATIQAPLAGSVGLTKTGAGSLLLSGTNTYTGVTTVSNGILQVANGAALGSTAAGTTVNSGATLDLNGTNLLAEPITLNGTGFGGGGALINSSASSGLLNGVTTIASNTTIRTDSGFIEVVGQVTGPGDITKEGGRFLFLRNGTNNYTGITTINGGTLVVQADNALGSAVGKTVVNPNTTLLFQISSGTYTNPEPIDLNNNGLFESFNFPHSFPGPITLSGSSAIYTLSNGSLTLTGNIGGTGGFTKIGADSLILNGNNAYDGNTIIMEGILKVGHANALGSLAGGTTVVAGVGNGAALDLNGITLSTEAITLNGNGVSGGGALINSAAGAGYVNGTTTLASDSTITAANGFIYLQGQVTGSGNLTKNGNGFLVLANNTNDYTGITTVNAGSLLLYENNALGAASGKTVVNSGGTLNFQISSGNYSTAEPIDLNGGANLQGSTAFAQSFAGPITLTGTSSIQVIFGGSLTLSGAIGGTGGFDKAGGDPLTLTGNNNYSGATTVSQGILKIGHANALGSTAAGTTVNNGGALDLNGFFLPAEAITLNGTGVSGGGAVINTSASVGRITGLTTLASNSTITTTSGVIEITGKITGSGNLTKEGSGFLTLNNSTSDYTGITTINAGTVTIIANNSLGSTSGKTLINSGTTLRLQIGSGGYTSAEPLDLNGGGTLQSVFTPQSFAGPITLSGSSTINTNTSAPLTLTGVLGGTGGFNKTGPEALILTNSNLYTGPTNVNAGTLTLNGGSIAASSLTTVASGATLNGTGTTGPLTINAGGFHKPGASPGITTVMGTYTENGNLEIEFLNDSGGPGVGHDQVIVNSGGNVVIGGTATLTTPYLGGTFNPTFGQVFTLIDNQGAATTTTGAFTGLPSGSPVTINGKPLKIYYDAGSNSNDVVLVSNNITATPITLYVDGSFVSPATVDGDRELAGFQTAYVSSNAFASPSLALGAYPATGANIVLNGGTYSSALLAGGGNITLNLVDDASAAEPNITLQNLSGDAADAIVTRFHGGTNANLIVEQGSFAGAISGPGTLTKTTGGTLVLGGSSSYTGLTAVTAGTLQVTSNNALGASASGTTVDPGATLELVGGVNYSTAEALSISAGGVAGNGALLAQDGTSVIFAGPISLAGNAIIGARNNGSGNSTLTLTGNVDKNGRTVTFLGNGNGNIINLNGGVTGPLPNSDLVVDNVTVNLNSTANYNGPTSVQNSGIFNVNAPLGNATTTNITVGAAGTGIVNQTGVVTVNGTGGITPTPGGANVLPANNVGPSGTGHVIVNAGSSYNLQGGLLDFRDYATGAPSNHKPDDIQRSMIQVNSGGAFNFTGGTLRDVSVVGLPAAGGGTLTQNGATTRFVIGQDMIGPGATTTINGNYTLQSGVMAFDIFGPPVAPEDAYSILDPNDRLDVHGTVTLNGTLEINFVAPFNPLFHQDWNVITSDNPIVLQPGFGVSGAFYRIVPIGGGGNGQALQVYVPEPGTITLWSLVGLAVGGYALRRRIRRA